MPGTIPQHERTKVVVTGLGETTALGGDVAGTWEAMVRGDNGIRLLDDEPWTREMPPAIGGRVKVEPGPGLEHRQRRRLSRSAQLAVTAAAEAWNDAGLDTAARPRRVAVVVSAALGDMNAMINGWEALKSRGWNRVPPLTVPMSMGNGSAAAVALLVNARAGVHATVNACSSGTQALVTAAELIRRGEADVVVAGGTEAPLHPLVLASFGAMRALSKRVDDPASASRPYDAERDGMVLGEGAGILVLESEEHARERGARIYAELAGVGVSSDAHDMVQPDPSGAGTARAIRASLADAGVLPGEVAHLNANGTATLPGDAAEAHGIRAVFGDAGRGPAVSANKSMTGHSLGAAGAIESITTVLSLHHGIVPPTRNFTRLDDGLSVDVVHGGPLKLGSEQNVAVKNSAGFGGHNVALTFRGVPAQPLTDPDVE
ncbi:beta-ketoacyl-[acyl-carrier-protein] synthase family protein [Streptomyces griseomycini]|uniref:3-oxoacyl-[acyl-carrier-protein] synthase II n=1 Tax=Streptomyces griseomycini TaxID=66895 RepID=A0A7W7LV60_9ACTN|nr:beta-ketoacyl-[acyl-carrier-protein] synthase family protein [Streptomyces griseomycini]MBB4896662.1 3-oxoacyl-[acyl-carrier-protein] synthase II [Streptomyces griseomycini]GGP85879.1 3-oxoacyl-[acyl-carrier-protein] synthase 2 [Streptomyces griseomycini]GGR00849.1 3-oxoacyl-[acyl-carrier-protein] synthase 2 [Streptomyces griseomycini]